MRYYKTVNTKLESVDPILINATTSTCIISSITDVGLTFLPISGGIACTVSLGN